MRTYTEVVGAAGEDHLERLTLRDTAPATTETWTPQWLFVFIGAAPITDWLDEVVARDDSGFVLTGPDCRRRASGRAAGRWTAAVHLETNVPGVFAAGDVRSESAKRVASAVGEGAMAVMLVHRYLEKL